MNSEQKRNADLERREKEIIVKNQLIFLIIQMQKNVIKVLKQ